MKEEILKRLYRKLVVSCQALPEEPLFGSQYMAVMARAAKEGGAGGIRANGVSDIHAIRQEVDLPVIGVGGIRDADDVLEFLSAGASAIQVGAQNLVDPWACPKIIEDLPRKMDEYGINDLQEIIGRAL